MSRHTPVRGDSIARPTALTTMMRRAASSTASSAPSTRESDRLARSSAAVSADEGDERQDGEHEQGPGRGQRPAQSGRPFGAGMMIEEAAPDPLEQDRDERERQDSAGAAERLPRRDPAAKVRSPGADDRADGPGVARRLARHVAPQLRIEDGGGAGERLVREQRASPGRDPGRVVVDPEEQRPGGAQAGVERVVLLLLAGDFGGRRVVCAGAAWLVLVGLRGELGETLRRRREPGRHIGDRGLQGDAERIVLRAQALKLRVAEVRLPQRVLDGGQRGAGRLEIEPTLVLRRNAADGNHEEDEGETAQESEGGLKRRLGQGTIR